MTEDRIHLTRVVESPPPQQLLDASGAPLTARGMDPYGSARRASDKAFRVIVVGIFLTFAWFATWGFYVLGEMHGYQRAYGDLAGWRSNVLSWSEAVLVVLLPAFIWLAGYIFIQVLRMTEAARQVVVAADRMMAPETTALSGVASVGEAVRDHVERLNEGVEIALSKLSSAEELIRKQTEMIEKAGLNLEGKASTSAQKIIAERNRLADITASLGKEADGIAAVLADKSKFTADAAQTAKQRLDAASTSLDGKVAALKQAAEETAQNCESLSAQLQAHTEKLGAGSEGAEAAAIRIAERLAKGRDALADISTQIEEKTAAAADRLDLQAQKTKEMLENIREPSPPAQEEALKFDLKRRRGLDDAAAALIPDSVAKVEQAAPPPVIEAAADLKSKRNAALDNLRKLDAQLAELRKVSDERRGEVRKVLEQQLSALRASATTTAAPAEPKPAAPSPERQAPQRLAEISEDIAARRTKPAETDLLIAKATPLEKGADKRSKQTPGPAGVETAYRKKADTMKWADILAAADNAGPDDEPPANENVIDIDDPDVRSALRRVQDATLEIERRLYGEPPRGAVNRFLSGERDAIAERLLRINERDLKKQLRNQMGADRAFEDLVRKYLADFDHILETSAVGEDADERMEALLGSRLGQLYLAFGGAVGYFA